MYRLCKEEIAHNKLNSLLETLESLGAEEVKQFRKRSSTRDLLLTIRNQIKIGLMDRIRKSHFFGLLSDEVTVISSVQNLAIFIRYYND